jgi:DUF4097 and DUF4098 domain-containing protein YvlB
MPNRVAIAAVVLAAGVLPGQAVFAQSIETERVERTFPLGSNGSLQLKNFSGRVRIRATAGGDVTITAVRRAPRERLDRIQLDMRQNGSTLSVDANEGRSRSGDDGENVVETDFDIQVPASTRLDIDAFSSEVTTTGVTAPQEIKTFSGRIDVRNAGASVEAKSFSGAILADTSGAPTASVSLETFSADMDIRLSDRAAGRVRFDTFSGNLQSDLPLTFRETSRRRIDAELPGGAGGSNVSFKSFSGDVRLRR